MAHITLTLELEVTETDTGTTAELADNIVSYLTSEEAPLFEDYGPDAWGGYDGAFITKATVPIIEVRP